jgi:hypothetical protein
MRKDSLQIPEFKIYEGEAAFWDNLDTGPFMEDDGEWFRFETPTLLEKIQLVERGQTKAEVARLLGLADKPTDSDWFYCLDEHASYVIFFDRENRVEAVNSWKS